MKRKLVILSMMFAVTFLVLPIDNTASAQNRYGNNGSRHYQPGRQRQVWRVKSKRKGPKWNHGYKNYGQYRKTQVGNRRFRSVRRPFWVNGVRVYRWVRIYY